MKRILSLCALAALISPVTCLLDTAWGQDRCAKTDQVIGLIGRGELGTTVRLVGVDGTSHIGRLLRESQSPTAVLERIARKDREAIEALRELRHRAGGGEEGPLLEDWQVSLSVGYAREELARRKLLPVPEVRVPPVAEVAAVELPRLATDPLRPSTTAPPNLSDKDSRPLPTTPRGVPHLDLHISASRSGLSVRIPPREQVRARGLARDLAGVDDVAGVLAGDPDVRAAVRTADGGLLLWMGNDPRVLSLRPESKDGGPSFEPVWLDRTVTIALPAGVDYVRLDLSPPADERVFIDAGSRGPPADAVAFVLDYGGERLPATVSRDGRSVYVEADHLRPARRDPLVLVRLARSLEAEALAGLIGRGVPGATVRVWPAVEAEQPPLISHLLAGESREAAALLALHPVESRRQLDAHRNRIYAESDRYLERGRFVEALYLLSEAERVHPDDPGLLIRKGVAQIGRGRSADAVEILNHIAEPRDPQPLLAEVYRRLKATPKGPARDFLQAASRVIAGRDLASKSKKLDVQAILVESDRPGIQMTLTEPASRPVEADRLTPDSAVYIDDSAGLSNLDQNPSPREALREAVAGKGYELLELYDPALALLPEVVRIVGSSERDSTEERTEYRARRARWSPPLASVTYAYVVMPLGDDDDDDGVIQIVLPGGPGGTIPPDRLSSGRVLLVRKKAGH